jgi:hypothetical protein
MTEGFLGCDMGNAARRRLFPRGDKGPLPWQVSGGWQGSGQAREAPLCPRSSTGRTRFRQMPAGWPLAMDREELAHPAGSKVLVSALPGGTCQGPTVFLQAANAGL